MQTLAEIEFNQSYKKTPSYILLQTNLSSKSEKPMYTQNPNLELCIEKNALFGASSPTFHRSWPLTPSMFWCICWDNKVRFTMVGKIVP